MELCCLASLRICLGTDYMWRVAHHTCSHSVTQCTQAQNKDFVHSLSAARNTYALTQEQQRTVRRPETRENNKMTRDADRIPVGDKRGLKLIWGNPAHSAWIWATWYYVKMCYRWCTILENISLPRDLYRDMSSSLMSIQNPQICFFFYVNDSEDIWLRSLCTTSHQTSNTVRNKSMDNLCKWKNWTKGTHRLGWKSWILVDMLQYEWPAAVK